MHSLSAGRAPGPWGFVRHAPGVGQYYISITNGSEVTGEMKYSTAVNQTIHLKNGREGYFTATCDVSPAVILIPAGGSLRTAVSRIVEHTFDAYTR